MSELNKKSYNKLLKFVVIYVFLIIIVTMLAMFLYSKYNIEIDLSKYLGKSGLVENEIDEGKVVSEINTTESEILENKIAKEENYDYSNIKRTTYLDKYYLNNLKKEDKKIKLEDIDKYKSKKIPKNKVSIEYFEINGLKNKDIENKINKEIEDRVKEIILDEEIYDKNIKHIRISASLEYHGNENVGFADLLSISLQKNIEYINSEKEYDFDYKYYGNLNFRLDTGEKLKLEDLFTKDASIKNILAQSIYNQLAFEYGLNPETGDGNFDDVDYGKIENDVFNIINEFNSQKEKIFTFGITYINIIVDDIMYSISTADYKDYINLYNIVNTEESLYENGNNEKVNYAFGEPYPSSFEYFGKISDNIYLSVFNVNKIYGNFFEQPYFGSESCYEYTDKLINNIDEIIYAIRNDDKNDDNKGYIYNISYYNNKNDMRLIENFEGTVFEAQKLEIDLENFDENAQMAYSTNCRQPTGGEYTYNLVNLIYSGKYDWIYELAICDINNDGKLEVGQKVLNYNDIYDDWNEYRERKFEF